MYIISQFKTMYLQINVEVPVIETLSRERQLKKKKKLFYKANRERKAEIFLPWSFQVPSNPKNYSTLLNLT